jgi:hypothetical protein
MFLKIRSAAPSPVPRRVSHGSQQWSRRACLPLAAFAVFGPPAFLPYEARGQIDDWQMYRREDLGFEVEMPGKPELTEEKGDDGSMTIDAEVTFASMLFGARYYTGPQMITVQDVSFAHHEGARHLSMKIIRETEVTMNGFPGLEFVSEADTFAQMLRVMVLQNAAIQVGVDGDHGLQQNALVQRFFGSFKLLRSGP